MDNGDKAKIYLLVNHPVTLLYFRKELISALINTNYVIGILTPFDEHFLDIGLLGVKVFETPMNRRGTNPIQDFSTFFKYLNILRKEKPDIVLSYTIKPNVYGGLACRVLGVPQIANVTGLGDSVENPGLLQKLVKFLLKIAFRKTHLVFFQNKSNKDYYEQQSLMRSEQTQLLPGSGVNLKKHSYIKYPQDDNTIRLAFVGRIIKDKGIAELLEAVAYVHANHPSVTCDILGPFEDDSFRYLIETYVSAGAGQYLGVSSDVHALLTTYHAVVLPSYHEGMSNVLLEAAATGRPVLTTRVPGCQEAFDEGISGFGFEPRSVDSLVEAIERFIALPHDQKATMGLAGSKKMEREFDRQIVVDAYMKEIENILAEKKNKVDKK
ncbi:N,N'-diacetylbacillosaminyl-diphospho-undecaprenol alpha-1,3-N-acetylgalactosaminyltransferase [bioreactor metagenome]|uniref:N, N'-diacetylbacillosaminyl-diphospho-undecaprenol alpha-1,3-N-acetylgalactosaminyltransferase n=1 Tax=bioreactor metagenome TaxID=1076179 RepID=A0A644WQY5_9ZZZZ